MVRTAVGRYKSTWHVVSALYTMNVLTCMLVTDMDNFMPLESSSYIFIIAMILRGSTGTTPVSEAQRD